MTHGRTCIGAGLLVALFVLDCAPIRVSVDYDSQADFSRYRTWGWLPESEATGNARADDPVLHRSIGQAIEAQLASQGYARVDDPQFGVRYHVSIDEKLYILAVDSGSGRAHYDGRETDIRANPTTYVNKYERGTLVIDVVDTTRDELVWRGAGERELRREPTPDEMTKSVHQVVAKILGRFPPSEGD